MVVKNPWRLVGRNRNFGQSGPVSASLVHGRDRGLAHSVPFRPNPTRTIPLDPREFLFPAPPIMDMVLIIYHVVLGLTDFIG